MSPTYHLIKKEPLSWQLFYINSENKPQEININQIKGLPEALQALSQYQLNQLNQHSSIFQQPQPVFSFFKKNRFFSRFFIILIFIVVMIPSQISHFLIQAKNDLYGYGQSDSDSKNKNNTHTLMNDYLSKSNSSQILAVNPASPVRYTCPAIAQLQETITSKNPNEIKDFEDSQGLKWLIPITTFHSDDKKGAQVTNFFQAVWNQNYTIYCQYNSTDTGYIIYVRGLFNALKPENIPWTSIENKAVFCRGEKDNCRFNLLKVNP